MTIAVCYQCGKFKHGAWKPCPTCGASPVEDDDIVLSLALTDHYFDQPTLDSMGERIAGGEEIKLDPSTKQNLLQQIHAPGFAPLLRMLKGPSQVKKPWWKFW